MSFRLPIQNTHKFDDLFVIDEEQGVAVIDDIGITSRDSRERPDGNSVSLLDMEGNFIYELRFYVNTGLCSNLGVNQVLVNVHREIPAAREGAFATAPKDPAAHAQSILGRKGRGVSQDSILQNYAASNRSETLIASDTIQLPIQAPVKVENPNQIIDTPVQDPAVTETRRARNDAGGTSQRYIVQVMNPQSQADLNQTSIDKLSLSGKTRSAYVNSDLKSAIPGPGFSGDNSPSATRSPTEDHGSIAAALLRRGIHPAEAVESLFPRDAIGGAFEHAPGEFGTRDELRVTRAPVRQPASTSFDEEVFERQFSRRSMSARNSPPQEAKNIFRQGGLDGKNFTDLARNLVKFTNADDAKDPVLTTNEGDFYSDYLTVIKKTAVPLRRAGTRPKLFFEIKLISPENPQLNLGRIFTVDHERQVREFTVPDKKPGLSLKRRDPGKNTVTLKQEDEFAASIILERRSLRPGENFPLPYELVGRFNLTNSDRPIDVEDLVDNEGGGLCVYRAVSIGPMGQRGISVAHVVAFDLNLPKQVGRNDDSKVAKNSFTSTCLTDGILLKLANYPDDALGFFIDKFPLNSPAAINRQPYRVVDSASGLEVQSVQGRGQTITVLDQDVVDRAIYTYYCQIKMPYGDVISTAPTHIEFLRPARSVPVSIEIANLSVSESNSALGVSIDSNISVKFDIAIEATESGVEEVIQTLTSAGVDGAFTDELRQDRSRISDLAFTEVIRVNLKNGKSESFGVSRERSFIDSIETRRAKGVNAVVRGDRFEYRVKLFLMSPESLFKGALTSTGSRSSTDLKKVNSNAKFLSQKFAKTYLGTTDLPSESELLENSSSAAIARGFTGIVASTEVQTIPRQVSLSAVASSRSPLGHNEVTWSVASGDAAIIDYFIISATRDGDTQPVGVVAADGNSQMFFYDRRFASFVGDISYTVVGVLIDGRKVQSPAAANVRWAQTMPKTLVDRLTASKNNTYFDRAAVGGTDPRILNPRGSI